MLSMTRRRIGILVLSGGMSLWLCASAAVAGDDRPYDGAPLTGDDFHQTPPNPLPKDENGNPIVANTATGTEISDKGSFSGPAGDVTYTPSQVDLKTVMDRDQSYNADPKNAGLLDHETGHFDLQEAITREAQAEVNKGLKDGTLKGKGANDEEAKSDLESKVQKIIDRHADERQKAYDDQTKHGTDPAAQAAARAAQHKALESPSTDPASKTGPELDSSSSKSLTFDAAAHRLAVTQDFITGVHGTDHPFSTSPSDPILKAQLALPTFLLAGKTSDGLFAFKAEGLDPRLALASDGTTFLDATLGYLLYDPQRNEFYGLTGGFRSLGGLSPTVDAIVAAGTRDTPALFGIELFPAVDFLAATAGFTASADVAITNAAGERFLPNPVPEPGSVILVAIGGLTYGAWRWSPRRVHP